MTRLINLATYTVLRPADTNTTKGSYDIDGKYIPGDETSASFTINGSNPQPITGSDLKLLPDGFTRTNTKKIYTKTLLRTFNEDTGEQADIIPLADGDYQVQVVEDWQGRKLKHYKVILVRKEKGNA